MFDSNILQFRVALYLIAKLSVKITLTEPLFPYIYFTCKFVVVGTDPDSTGASRVSPFGLFKELPLSCFANMNPQTKLNFVMRTKLGFLRLIQTNEEKDV